MPKSARALLEVRFLYDIHILIKPTSKWINFEIFYDRKNILFSIMENLARDH